MENKKLKNIFIDIFIFVFIALFCFSNIFSNSIGNLDEIWNYNFAKNICDGLVPYRDFNMVQMPLLSMICAICLKAFGNQLIVMRVLAVILMSLIFFVGYKILKLVTNDKIAKLILPVILVLFNDILCIDYNYAVLFIALVILYVELRHLNKLDEDDFLQYNFRYNFVIGLIAGLSVLCKQTTGIAISMACIGYKIFAIRKKDDIKLFFKIAFTRIFGVIIPLIIFAIYLLFNGAIEDFIDYTILGLSTFSNSIPYSNLLKNNVLKIFAIVVPIVLVVMFVRLFVKDTDKKLYVFFAYSISSFIVTFPICDKIHFLTGSLIAILAICYMLYDDFIVGSQYSKVFKLICYGAYSFTTIFLVLLLLFESVHSVNRDFIKVDKEKELNHFYYIPENVGLKDRIFEIDDYIMDNKRNGKNVYMLDAEAALYTIPLDIYNKDYDMFLKGNLGSKGEDGIIERIQKEENAVYLLKMDYLNWQNPNKVRDYIMSNLNYKGNISIFYIYEK